MEEQKTVDEKKPAQASVVQQVIKTTAAPAAPARYARGSVGVEEDMPFETVTHRVKPQRKKRDDSDEISDYDDREEAPSSEEEVKPEPVVEPVPKKAGKKGANKAAPPQKQAAQPAKTTAAAGKGRTPSANERDLQKQREELAKKAELAKKQQLEQEKRKE